MKEGKKIELILVIDISEIWRDSDEIEYLKNTVLNPEKWESKSEGLSVISGYIGDEIGVVKTIVSVKFLEEEGLKKLITTIKQL